MKNLKIILLSAIGIFMFFQSSIAQETEKIKSDTVKYWVSMDCENCVAKIEKNIAFEKGVKSLDVDLKTKTVTIGYKDKKTSPEKLEKAIQDLGYKTEKIEVAPPDNKKK